MSIFSPDSTKNTVAFQGNNAYGRYMAANKNRGFDWRLPAAMVAAPVAQMAAPAMFGGGAAAGGGGAAATSAGTAAGTAATGAGMTLGKLWDIGNLGLQGVSAFMGNRSNNRALDRQIGMQERQMAMQLQADAEARAEAKRQFDANQANEQRRMAAEDEERVFARTEREAAQRDRDYQRQLIEQRETRRAPYRAASRAALGRLGDFLGVRF